MAHCLLFLAESATQIKKCAYATLFFKGYQALAVRILSIRVGNVLFLFFNGYKWVTFPLSIVQKSG